MQQWVDLITPSLAVIAVFLGVGLLVQAIRHSRAIRRIEDRLTAGGGAATDASLDRLRALQQRSTTSAGGVRGGIAVNRRAMTVVGALVGVAVVAAAVWFLFLRGGGSGDGATGPGTTGTTTRGSTSTNGTSTAAPAPDPNVCTAPIAPLDDNSLVTVSIFNASGLTGKAREKVKPLIDGSGYTVGAVANPPDNRSDLQTSVVQYVSTADRNAACNVAKDLGLRPVKVTPLEGFTIEQAGGADVKVVVLVGTDLASR